MFQKLKQYIFDIFDKIRMWVRLRMICDVLDIKLYPHVRRFVLNKDESILSMGRSSGKTVALLLRALVYKDIPKTITNSVSVLTFIDDPDLVATPVSRYREMLVDAVYKCEAAGIAVTRD